MPHRTLFNAKPGIVAFVGALLLALSACSPTANNDESSEKATPTSTSSPSAAAILPPVSGPPPAIGIASSSVKGFTATLGDMERKRVAWNTSYMSLKQQVDTDLLDAAAKRGVKYHIITLELIGFNLHDVTDNDGVGQKIDQHLDRIAFDLGAWHSQHPDNEIIIRPLHEANGNWYPWGFGTKGGKPNNGNSIDKFKMAWWHIRGRMVSSFEGLKFFWCPNGLLGDDVPFSSWYPGDKNVDYVGFDKYNHLSEAQTSWQDPTTSFQPTLNALRAAAPGKPVIIGETGTRNADISRDGSHTKAEWFTQLDAWRCDIATRYGVVALIYFNFDKTADHGNDWRIFPKGQPDAKASQQAFVTAMKAC